MSTGAALQHSPRTTIPGGSVARPTVTQSDLIRIGRTAERKFGLTVAENPWFGGVSPVHATDSYHYKGLAIDVSGDPAKMDAFAKWVEKRYTPVLAELIHNGGSGGSYSIKGGQKEPSSFWGAETWAAHANHVHVALEPSLLKGKQSRYFGGRSRRGMSPAELKKFERIAKEEGGELGTDLPFEGAFEEGPGKAGHEVIKGAASAVDFTGEILKTLENPESLMLNVALVGGGAFLVYYGAALLLGVKKPVAGPAKMAAKGAVATA